MPAHPTVAQEGGKDLVFIMGNHRSGTTILYNLLARVGPFSYPTPFHIVNLRDYLAQPDFDWQARFESLERRFEADAIVDRFIDDIAAGPRTPEEYGFMLERGHVCAENLPAFEEILGFLRATPEAKPLLLLKNPRDVANFRFLHEAYPKARFIFIHRHPGPLIVSRIRELRDIFAARSPYQTVIEPGYDRIMSNPLLLRLLRIALWLDRPLTLFFIIELYRNSKYLLENLPALPPESHVSVTYEGLCADPEAAVGRILEFLALEVSDLSSLRDKVRPRDRRYSPNFLLRSETLRRWLKPYLDSCGYRGLWPEGSLGGA